MFQVLKNETSRKEDRGKRVVGDAMDTDNIAPAGNYMFQVNNRNIRTILCSNMFRNMFKVNNKRYQNDAIGVVLVSLLLTWTYFTHCSTVFTVNFEQVNTSWDSTAVFSVGKVTQSILCKNPVQNFKQYFKHHNLQYTA